MSSLEQLWAGWRSEYIERVTRSTESGCVFCSILASGLPDEETYIVWRHPGGDAIAILNAFPYATGHLLVMPVRHAGEIEALGPAEESAVWSGVRDGVRALKHAYDPDGLNVGANLGRSAGAGVPEHFHVHVVPRWHGDTNFMTSIANARVLPEALSVSAEKIRAAWPPSPDDGSRSS